jgi:hypothetical protein
MLNLVINLLLDNVNDFIHNNPMQSKLLIDTTYAIHTNYKYIELILKPYHMSSSDRKS